MTTTSDGGSGRDASTFWRQGERDAVAEKRESARVRHGDAARAYNVDKIGAQVFSEQRGYPCSLLDLSAGGAALLTAAPLPLGVAVAVELKVGERFIRARGLVKNRSKLGGRYRLGVQFTELDPEEQGFLHLLYGPGGRMEELDGLPGEA